MRTEVLLLLGKTKLMATVCIAKDGLSKSKVYPCRVSSLRIKANSVLCVQCGRWIHGRCVRVIRVTPRISGYFTCRKCQENIGEAAEQEEKLCDGSVNSKGIHISWWQGECRWRM